MSLTGFWSVAQTESQREGTAAVWLGRAGFETYLPKIKVVRQVTDRQHRVCTVSRIEPLFRSYLFVRVIDRWYQISNTIGVIQLLLDGERPAPVPEREIMKIKAQERGGLVRLPPPPGLKRGDQVRVIHGMFFGRIGLWQGMSGKDREHVLLDLLGRQVRVDFPSHHLQALEQINGRM
jgi:transcriptional antiterminator RfaH